MSPPTRIQVLLAAALAGAVIYFCFFSRLDALGLVGPDEPRYAGVAREMAESGDWVTPRLNGKPWFEKPVLYYWAAGAAFGIFGVNESAARLPSALAATLAAAALAWAAWRFYGAATAAVVVLIFPTTVAAIGFARAATPDMLFGAWLTLAMIAAACAVWKAEARGVRLWQAAFGAALGVAALAKGPAGVVLAAGSIGLWTVSTRRWRDAFRLAHPVAVMAFLGVALPWYALCARRNPEFVDTFLISHNIQRYLTPVFRHEQPIWFYAPILALGLVPWTALAPGALRRAIEMWREKGWRNSPAFFFACWAIFPVIFFSFSKSKLPGYLVPVVPPLALLLARGLVRETEKKTGAGRWLLAAVGLTFVGLALSAGSWVRRLPEETIFLSSRSFLLWVVVGLAAGTGVAALSLAGRARAAVVVSALLVALGVEALNRWMLPRLDAQLSPRTAARAALGRGPQALSVHAFRLHRAWHYGLNFYLRRPVPEWSGPGSAPALVYTTAAGVAELERQGTKPVVLDRVARQAVVVRIEPAGR